MSVATDCCRRESCHRCTHCSADLSLIPSLARFCPSCGKQLSSDRSSPVGRRLSEVVRGYANAMLRLGIRYETRHNDDEAVRCYGKASRLGNEAAAERLITIPNAAVADTNAAEA